MRNLSLMQFHARVHGRSAHVKILPNRIVWTVSGVSRISEMVPVTSISSVVTAKSVNSKWSIVVLTSGKAVEFLVDKTTAQRAAVLVEDLVATQSPSVTNSAPPSGRGSLAEDLIRLNWDLENGMLTEAEFHEEHARLFGL